MKHLFLLLTAMSAWGQQTSPAPAAQAAPAAAPADPVVLTIGDVKITKSQFDEILAEIPEQQRAQVQTPQGRRQVAQQFAQLEVLAQEARQRKLDQNPTAQTRLKLASDQVLARIEYQDLGDAKPDEAAMRAYYAVHQQEWEQVKARHILIRVKGSQVPLRPNQRDMTDAEALVKVQELRGKILAGEDFATLAKIESDDTGSALTGGELEPFSKGRMVPEFEKAAFALDVGKVSEPVKTQFGYHLILVEAHTTKSFEDARPEIEQKMKPEMAQKGLDALLKKTPPVLDEAYFGK